MTTKAYLFIPDSVKQKQGGAPMSDMICISQPC